MTTAARTTNHALRRMRTPDRTVKKPTIASAAYRLHQLHGEAPATWETRIYGAASDYQQVARINHVLRSLGMTDKVCELMAPIDASCGSMQRIGLMEALHQAEMADCIEQPTDETFREKLRRNIATVEEGHEYIRKSAIARAAAEQAEIEVAEWIAQQESAANGH